MEKFRLPAEWEPQEAVLLAWPDEHTDWNYILDEAQLCVGQIVDRITRYARVVLITHRTAPELSRYISHLERVTLVDVPYNDTWARDFGPITLTDDNGGFRSLDFMFNGWGLKFAADKDNQITSRLHHILDFKSQYVNKRGFVLEGGSIESDGEGTILTTSTCLMKGNRNDEMSLADVEAYLKSAFNAHKVLWLEHGELAGDDTDGHVDTLARLAPGKTIVYVGADADDTDNGSELAAMEAELKIMAEKYGYRLVSLPNPDAIYDEDGLRLPATYANFLIINGAVIMPVYGQPENDAIAIESIASAFPGYIIETVDCNALIKQHGSLHCVTMQLPEKSIRL